MKSADLIFNLADFFIFSAYFTVFYAHKIIIRADFGVRYVDFMMFRADFVIKLAGKIITKARRKTKIFYFVKQLSVLPFI